MKGGLFRFKQFSIRQDRCAMKVGTDGILLGSWADLQEASHILDIGTGTGLLALMAAQRNPTARIDGIEIDAEAAAQASENVLASPWKNRVSIFSGSVQEFSPLELYDHILCNPPFFQKGMQPENALRRQARHAMTLPARDLLEAAQRLLLPQGCLSLVLPSKEAEDFLVLAKSQGWNADRQLHLRSRANKPVFRYLIQLSQTGESGSMETMLIYDLHSDRYSEAYQDLTGAFYL